MKIGITRQIGGIGREVFRMRRKERGEGSAVGKLEARIEEIASLVRVEDVGRDRYDCLGAIVSGTYVGPTITVIIETVELFTGLEAGFEERGDSPPSSPFRVEL